MHFEILIALVFLLQSSLANTPSKHPDNLGNSDGLESTLFHVPYHRNGEFRRFGQHIRMQRAQRQSNIGSGTSSNQQGSPLSVRDSDGHIRAPRTGKRNKLNLRTPKKKTTTAPAASAAKPATLAAPATAAKPAAVPKESKKEAKAAAKVVKAAAQAASPPVPSKKEAKAAAKAATAAAKAASPPVPSKKEAKAAAKAATAAAKAASPPAPSKKEAKKIKSAAKLLNSDAEKELKTQNKDEQHAVKNLQGIQDKATKATQKTTTKNMKNEAKSEADLQKDQAAYQKASTNPQGKKGVKAAAKAETALNKDKVGLIKTQQGATNTLQKINDGENKALDKNTAKLDKGIQKAHSAQFNKDGVAKEHPTTWQKFKKVMGYIGTGILDVLPGTEEIGAAVTIARTAVTLGAKAAAKAAGKAAAKVGVKAAKEKGKDAAETALSGPQPVDPVTAAKTETDTQKANAQANADNLKAQYQQAASHVQHPAATPIFKRGSSLVDHFKVATTENNVQKAAANAKANDIKTYYQNAAANVRQPASQKAKRDFRIEGQADDGKATVRTSHNIVVRDPASNKLFFLPPTWS
ncbi:hypothetical protein MMC27_004404 [Xylographa pallens]|nr:hypothetical protein [Xylographa pallens]